MKWLFIAAFVAAVCVQMWTRLSVKARATITQKARDMIAQAQRMAQAMSNRIFRRRYAYQTMFLSEKGKLNDMGQVVIADLTKFCRALNSIAFTQTGDGHTDLFRTGVAEGRREVFLHIIKELGLDLSQVMENAKREEEILAA